ncbi:MAG: hypothetical protein EBR74_05980 [Flavobacteriia bacterium]|nr:hypothetical protein [Flavobacteriia bacterium]
MGNKLACIFILLCAFNSFAQKRYMVFANGYLGPHNDAYTTQNLVTQKAPGYWYNIDDTIIQRFQPIVPYYISGHHPISTSAHRSKGRAAASYLLTRFCFFRSKKGFGLNTKPNPEGYAIRYKNGQLCGQNFLQMVKDSFPKTTKKDTLDLVCHSMGYVYSVGFLSALDTHFVLGKILILAPEMPTMGDFNWNSCMEVWQYGSNLGEDKADFICFQDGIAPQAPVNHLDDLMPGKGGRVFVPRICRRGFIKSHHLQDFLWFYDLKPNEKGYFTR